jgi:hypothetical protein
MPAMPAGGGQSRHCDRHIYTFKLDAVLQMLYKLKLKAGRRRTPAGNKGGKLDIDLTPVCYCCVHLGSSLYSDQGRDLQG